MSDNTALTILVPLPEERTAIRSILFDFDGTISTMRQGWEGIMGPLMVEMIAGPTKPTEQLIKEVNEYIDYSTGIQTIHQMKWLAEAVACRGLNPEVHDEWWYKAEYNRRLMEPVSKRAAKILSGEAATDDFTIAGSRRFLDALREAGITLYVASGTDHKDVVREVGTLGFSDYFVEIAGAPEGTTDCSKEAVLRRLIEEAGLAGPEVVVVGDGRVEIALGREMGTLTLGVATDEVRRQGVNPAKFARLEKAGAHAIVGDFAAHKVIQDWLGI